jgi:hypothetical protein
MAELPFMATENIMMRAVKKGGDRQALHERLREHSLAAAAASRRRACPTTSLGASLPTRSLAFPVRNSTKRFVGGLTGRAPEQVTELLDGVIRPVLQKKPRSDRREGHAAGIITQRPRTQRVRRPFDFFPPRRRPAGHTHNDSQLPVA